jgi:hypothetical protein
MSPLVSIRIQVAEVRDYIKTLAPDTLPYRIAVAQLQSLQKQHSRISSNIPVHQPPQPAPIPAPIKCGLRAISNAPKQEKKDPWVWDSSAEKQAKLLERAQNQIRAIFFTTAEPHVLKRIAMSGGLKKNLTALGFAPLTLLPEFLRKEQGTALFQTFIKKLLK